MCSEPTKTASAPASDSLPHAESSAVAAHRVLELGAVRLHGVARAARGRDGPAEQNVVREDEVGGQMLAQGRRVRRDVALTLGSAQVRRARRTSNPS